MHGNAMSKVYPGLVDFAGVCLEFITLTVWSDPLKIQALLNIPWMVWVTIRPSVDCHYPDLKKAVDMISIGGFFDMISRNLTGRYSIQQCPIWLHPWTQQCSIWLHPWTIGTHCRIASTLALLCLLILEVLFPKSAGSSALSF